MLSIHLKKGYLLLILFLMKILYIIMLSELTYDSRVLDYISDLTSDFPKDILHYSGVLKTWYIWYCLQ